MLSDFLSLSSLSSLPLLSENYQQAEREAVNDVLEEGQLEVPQIPFKDLHLEKMIGQGAYGDVIKVVLRIQSPVTQNEHKMRTQMRANEKST